MTTFQARYKNLNTQQAQAVDAIDGPLLVIAGPGTGKTELLSMRAANILQKTDTLPESILCLTFTESGATAMRARLAQIIGPAAYKVAIHTFHGFGTEIINQNNQYFYQGADFKPADDISRYEILRSIFDELDHANPLASKFDGEYTYLRDAMTAISELKQAGLTSDELLTIVASNEATLDATESDLATIFANKINLAMIDQLADVATTIAHLPTTPLPVSISPLVNSLALSLAQAVEAASESNKTTPLTAWRNAWMEKDSRGAFVFKDRKRHAKLRALAQIYFSYLSRMEQAALYDYDDMVLNVVHGMELHPDLKYNLQERYHYIMVDEFQDTNLAQLRILFNLTQSPTGDTPNIMAVGDDDQAIYSFQGADVNNIHKFRERYPDYKSVVLTNNYRSTTPILDAAREVVVQATGRLETSMNISKKLTAHQDAASSEITLNALPTRADEAVWVAEQIAQDIRSGTNPRDIAIIARRHSELTELLPYLRHHNIAVNYERRDNILDLESIQTLELLAQVCVALADGDHEVADSLLPQLLSHPMFTIDPEMIWRLSVTASRNRLNWLEAMMTMTEFKSLAQWLIARSAAVWHETLEVFIDSILGAPTDSDQESLFVSPYYAWYFGPERLQKNPDAYLVVLDALRLLRTKLREFHADETPHIQDLLAFMNMHRQLKSPITSIRSGAVELEGAIHLLTAHKSKGLEFDTVYVVDSIDSMWGERVRSRSPLISYPENLTISPNADSYDERVRLYYVAMTRAKRNLHLSYAQTDANDKDTLVAGFLTGTTLIPTHPHPTASPNDLVLNAQLAWHEPLTTRPTQSMKDLLQPHLDRYKLSITHLNNFIDISRGGPATFLMNSLLRFPQARSSQVSYGTAIHAALQRAHNHLTATGERRPIEDVIGDFYHALQAERLPKDELAALQKRGADTLEKFLAAHYHTFMPTQKTELNFAGQNIIIGDARLTGALDLVDIKDDMITVTDYKTGKPSASWQGKTDAEKIKLHKYRQQLMFYQILVENSRDYSKYHFQGGVLQFVEPDQSGELSHLEAAFSDEELERFSTLIRAIWQSIMTLDFPDISKYDPTYKGILQFEQDIIDRYSI